MKMVRATLVAAIAAAVQFASPALLSAEESGRPALMIEIDGAIGPATARYVKEALTTAGERRVDVVILRLNTPGGLATSMREIIADVLGSSVPVIGYVAPSVAHAASAGTYILYATQEALANVPPQDADCVRLVGVNVYGSAARLEFTVARRTRGA